MYFCASKPFNISTNTVKRNVRKTFTLKSTITGSHKNANGHIPHVHANAYAHMNACTHIL